MSDRLRGVAASLPALALAFTLGVTSSADAYFERTEIGSRALALGRAFVGVANDASAIYWNPAGLTQLDRREILLNYHRPYLVADLTHNSAAVAWPHELGTFYASWGHLGLSGVQSEDLFYFGGARRVWEGGGKSLSAAATLKFARVSYSGAVATGSNEPVDLGGETRLTGDVGLFFRWSPRLTAGWTLRNLGRPRYDFVPGNGQTVIDLEHEAGVAYRWHPESLLSLALRESSEGGVTVAAGVEVEFYDVFALRVGAGDLQFNGGVGVRQERLRVDAGFVTHDELGVTTMFSVSVLLGDGS